MLILLSPAKDLSTEVPKSITGTSAPVLLEHSVPLVDKLRKLSARKLEALMDISPKLAALNHERYQAWQVPFTRKNALPAVFCFNGEAYRGLAARTLDNDDLRFAQRHLRILSGLYGVLRPLDLMQPYRLEMGTRTGFGKAKDLYAYWGDRITDALNADLKATESKVLVNLASAEYFKAVRPAGLQAKVITPVFKEKAKGGYKVVMLFAKHQRGAMARHIIRYRLHDPEDLKDYQDDGYRYVPSESTDEQWAYLRDKN